MKRETSNPPVTRVVTLINYYANCLDPESSQFLWMSLLLAISISDWVGIYMYDRQELTDDSRVGL
jgi:hypothetical protein